MQRFWLCNYDELRRGRRRHPVTQRLHARQSRVASELQDQQDQDIINQRPRCRSPIRRLRNDALPLKLICWWQKAFKVFSSLTKNVFAKKKLLAEREKSFKTTFWVSKENIHTIGIILGLLSSLISVSFYSHFYVFQSEMFKLIWIMCNPPTTPSLFV